MVTTACTTTTVSTSSRLGFISMVTKEADWSFHCEEFGYFYPREANCFGSDSYPSSNIRVDERKTITYLGHQGSSAIVVGT